MHPTTRGLPRFGRRKARSRVAPPPTPRTVCCARHFASDGPLCLTAPVTENMNGDIGSQQYVDMHIALGVSVMFWGRLEGRMKFLLSALTGAEPEVGHVLTANLTVAQMLDVGLHLVHLTCTEEEAKIVEPWLKD